MSTDRQKKMITINRCIENGCLHADNNHSGFICRKGNDDECLFEEEGDNPKDFIHWTCKKCPEKIDDPDESELAGYPEGCTSNATRDHAPTLCPCRGEPDWKVGYIIAKGEYL